MGNSVNAHIHQYLTSYLKRENPQYAVMLNGAWGCGKTFFIRKWKESIKSKDIKPIYVSLFGLQTIKEINELINKELHPILTSKATKTIIKITVEKEPLLEGKLLMGVIAPKSQKN